MFRQINAFLSKYTSVTEQMNMDTNPLEAGLGFFVHSDKASWDKLYSQNTRTK